MLSISLALLEMLLEFTVENFRSFRERQKFSMVNEKPSEDTIFFDRTVEIGFGVAPYLESEGVYVWCQRSRKVCSS